MIVHRMNIRRVALAVATSIMTWCTAAPAGGINIAWDDCFGGGGHTNRVFACNSNLGSEALVVTFEPSVGIAQLVGGSSVIDLETATSAIPSWWQVGAGGCRDGAIHFDTNPAGQTCPDPWSAAATGSLSYYPGFGGHNDQARIVVSWGIPEALAGSVETGTEYFACRLILDHSSSLGSGSCSGCNVPVCFYLEAVWLYQSGGLGAQPLCNPLNSPFATWQGGAVPGGCPGTDGPPPPFPYDCLATPAARRSWGLIKSLYR